MTQPRLSAANLSILPGEDLPIRVRVSARARRIAIHIDAAAAVAELVLPKRARLETGLAFIESKRDWITSRLAAVPRRIPFTAGAEVPVLGVPHRIRHLGEGVRGTVSIAEGEIRVAGGAAHVPRRVRDYLMALAKRVLGERARRLAARLGRKVARVTVRDTRSRWGSCTAAGHLSFSWRLVLAPEAVLDYVVAHEVAHLIEMNHGPHFWKLVAGAVPRLEEAKHWLRNEGTDLHRYAG
jgi:predicted metal-dependent hydrolase